jgi:glycosyltransferase involved in cell wall biosynthesis
MRILLTADPELPVPPPLYGGIERIVDALIRQLLARAHSVALVAHRESTVPATQRFAWPGLRSQVAHDTLRNAVALSEAVAAFKPDVIHSFSRLLYLLPLLPRSLPKIMSYQRLPGRRQVAMAALLGRGSLQFTGCSQYICDVGMRGGGSWHAIHNFVDLDVYPFQKVVPADAPLVFLSRIEPLKGAHIAIEVARRTGRRLIMAGNHSESGPEGAYWRDLIAPQLRSPMIDYVGPVNDRQKAELLGSAAAMIVPIQWEEPFGIVFAEALACGTPVISCPRGALPEIVRQGIDGFLVSSVEEACSAVLKIPELSRSACRERAEQCFSAHVISGKYERLYETVAA